MKVKDVMIREARCCAPADALNRAAQIMWENDCGCVPVIDGDSKTIANFLSKDQAACATPTRLNRA